VVVVLELVLVVAIVVVVVVAGAMVVVVVSELEELPQPAMPETPINKSPKPKTMRFFIICLLSFIFVDYILSKITFSIWEIMGNHFQVFARRFWVNCQFIGKFSRKVKFSSGPADNVRP
jgi:hypothetical protein